MSNYLAIATVTAALRELLLPAVQSAVAGATVTLARPHAGSAGEGAPESASVNLYLYQVTANPALRNVDLPLRGSDGGLRQRAACGFDLHYLLTFYGSQQSLEPERLLGGVLRTLHEQAILARRSLEQLINDPQNGYPDLNRSDLHRAAELVKFRPLPLSLEELSKLWSVFLQTPYTLSAAYVGSLVLIESDIAPAAALPVRSRQIFVDTLRRPVIEQVLAGENPAAMPLAAGKLTVRGHQLRGDESTRVRVSGRELAAEQVTDARIDLDLAGVPAPPLRAGVHGLQVVHHRSEGGALRMCAESNVAPLMLHPRIVAVNLGAVTERGALRDVDIVIEVTPAVGADQRIALLLNRIDGATAPSHTFALAAPATDSTSIESTLRGVAPGAYAVRIQVDGAPSPLDSDAAGHYHAPQVAIP